MNLATAVTSARIVLGPVFFGLFVATVSNGLAPAWSIALLWAIFLVMEATDWFDGAIARSLGHVTDLGKLLDPFADSLSRLTYFFAFVISGMMPGWIFLLVMYRDLGVSFIRLIQMKRGITMGARLSGKIKAWVYGVTGGAVLALVTVESFDALRFLSPFMDPFTAFCFFSTAVTAIWTLLDYALSLREKA